MSDVKNWTTHCIGRYLVELPPSARVQGQYKIWGNEIRYLPGETPGTFQALVDKRVAELEATSREGHRGNMLFDRMVHGDKGSTSILSWADPHSKAVLLRKSYFVATSPWRLFTGSGEVTVDRTEIARKNADRIANRIRSRDSGEIPAEPGFCIEGGLIAGRDYQDESFRLGIELPEHPNAQIFINARTGREQNRLLDRTGGFLVSLARGLLPGLKVLRKGERAVGPIQAQEFATAASAEGQRVYAFAWEAQGKDESLANQNITVRLQVLEQSVVSEKTPYQPAFKSDEEALQLWDNIIESVRLRPGAV
ncbi:T6SS immunity protein Tli4 family protein [Paracidovorax citrulli]